MVSISLNYTSNFDGVTTDVHVDTCKDDVFFLGSLADMFLTFVRGMGFHYVANVVFVTDRDNEFSALDA